MVTARREIDAGAEVIFELIADPAQQPEWDGNDNLAEAAPGQRVRAVGDVFTMTLTNGGPREPRRRVRRGPASSRGGRRSPGAPPAGPPVAVGARAARPGPHRVTHTYDWTHLTDEGRFARARATTSDRLGASLERLAARVE